MKHDLNMRPLRASPHIHHFSSDFGFDSKQPNGHGYRYIETHKNDRSPSPIHTTTEERISLSLFWPIVANLLRRRTRLVIWATLLACLTAMLGVSKLENKFTATSMVLLDQGTSRLLAGTTSENRGLPQLNADAEVEILKSENVSLRTLEKLGPTLPPEFSPEPGRLSKLTSAVSRFVSDAGIWVREIWSNDSDSGLSSPSSDNKAGNYLLPDPLPPKTALALRVLKESIEIRRRALTDIIAIEATSTNAALAAHISNVYATSYLEEQKSAKLRALQQVETVLKARLSELDSELKRSGPQLGLRQEYQDTQVRLYQLEQQRDTVSADARIVSIARPPRNPNFPNSTLLAIIGVVISSTVGFAFALGVAYVGEVRSPRIRTEKELEQVTGVENLASIPAVRSRSKRGSSSFGPTVTHPTMHYTDSIHRLYYNLALEMGGSSNVGVVLLTSTKPNEGKAPVGLDLARAAASTGSRVLIVDCDIRQPELHEILDLENEHGFVDLIRGTSDSRRLIQDDPASTCKIITGGGMGQGYSEQAFQVNAVHEVVKKLQAEFDLVLLLGAPMNQSAESLLLVSCAKSVLYMVSSDKISPAELRDGMHQITRLSDCKVFTAFNLISYGG